MLFFCNKIYFAKKQKHLPDMPLLAVKNTSLAFRQKKKTVSALKKSSALSLYPPHKGLMVVTPYRN